ncbi:hypothetical protein M9H77_01887 [Catharanthus roseus]|uniref:Uncharacterized protein n=1 Tax=Catharanthus roseus TaxID=4058 RepID=A0ACC0C6T9_CATRO|nr:hypothetical protein M9H77_01887 [Catharanthus roseus]
MRCASILSSKSLPLLYITHCLSLHSSTEGWKTEISSPASGGSSSSCSAARTPGVINHFLARVYSSGLSQMTKKLRGSENFIIQNPPHFSQHLGNDIVHYNPSNIGLWVNSFSSELSQPSLPFFHLVERVTPYGSTTEFLQPHFSKNETRTRRFQHSVNPRDDDLRRDNPIWQSLIGLHFGRETPRCFGMLGFSIRHWQGGQLFH